MPYLARLVEQSGMVVGAPQPGGERTATTPQRLELDSVLEAAPPPHVESPPPSRAAKEPPAFPASPSRAEPSRAGGPARSPAPASADAPPQQRLAGRLPAEIVVEASEPPLEPAAAAAAQSTPASMRHTEIVEVTPSAVSRQPAQAEATDEAAPPTAPRGPVTLAEVRAWVAATPATDELRLAPRPAAPIEENEIVVAAAAADVPPPQTRRTAREPMSARPRASEPTQDVHLTIGSIVVTVDGPERTPAAAAPPPAPPTQPRRDVGASTRLLRHYLRS